MKKLKEKFSKNGLPYNLIQRNDVVVIYSIGGTYTKKILHYEVCKIHIRNDQYGHREAIPSNEQFGQDGSKVYIHLEDAKRYFSELTNQIEIAQRASVST